MAAACIGVLCIRSMWTMCTVCTASFLPSAPKTSLPLPRFCCWYSMLHLNSHSRHRKTAHSGTTRTNRGGPTQAVTLLFPDLSRVSMVRVRPLRVSHRRARAWMCLAVASRRVRVGAKSQSPRCDTDCCVFSYAHTNPCMGACRAGKRIFREHPFRRTLGSYCIRHEVLVSIG